jgi:chromosome segregation ATPase
LDTLLDITAPPPNYEESTSDSLEKSITDYQDEILMLQNEIQFLRQEKIDFDDQIKELQSLKEEKTKLELIVKKNDQELTLLKNEIQNGKTTIQHQTDDITVNPLKRENQELKLKISGLEYQVKSKDEANKSLETENHSLQWESATFEYQIKAMEIKINKLENKNHTSARRQDSPTQEKTMDQQSTLNEMELLKASNATLEQLLKSKEDVILSLNREIQTLSTVNQDGMVETLKSLLQSKSNEIELNKLNAEHVLAKEKKKNKKLQKEIEMLKQKTASSNGSMSGSADIKDDASNDINYNTEDSSECENN